MSDYKLAKYRYKLAKYMSSNTYLSDTKHPDAVVSGGGYKHIRGGAIKIDVANVGHVTICSITKNQTLPDEIYNALHTYFTNISSRQGNYIIQFTGMWGANSVLLEQTTKLVQLQKEIFGEIRKLLGGYSGIIDTSRYPSGLPQAHIDIHGDQVKLNKYLVPNQNKEQIIFDFSALS